MAKCATLLVIPIELLTFLIHYTADTQYFACSYLNYLIVCDIYKMPYPITFVTRPFSCIVHFKFIHL